MQTSSIILVLATVAACTVYSAFSLPISKRETGFAYTIWSKESGLYMKMLDSGLVEATGKVIGYEVEPSGKWILRMTSDNAVQLENALHRGHYLVLAKHNGKTTLLTTVLDHSSSQGIVTVHRDRLVLPSAATRAESTADTLESTVVTLESTDAESTAVTRESTDAESTEESVQSTVESTVTSTGPEGSASGSGEVPIGTPTEMTPTDSTPTDTTTAASTPTDVTTTETMEEEYVAVEYNWLYNPPTHREAYSNFQIKPTEGQREVCFLAFNEHGFPASNLCDVPEASSTIELTINAAFYSSF